MKHRFLLTCILILVCHYAMGQISLTGLLTDSLGNTVTQESSVTLITKKDMLKVVQANVEEGRFTLRFTPQNDTDYMLYVFALGYKDRYLEIPKQGGDMGKITLSPLSLTLREVVIRPGRLQHDIVNGNDVFQIAGTSLAREHSVNTLLNRLPGVFVVNDQVTVVGAGTPTFTINGQAPRPGEMDMITPDRIDKITINTMPSAKYSTKVGSIIDLKLKKTLKDYLSINLMNELKASSTVLMEQPSAYINLSAGKFSAYMGYFLGFNHVASSKGYSMEHTQLPNGTEYLQESRNKADEVSMDWTHTFNIAPRYQINDKSSIDIQYSLSDFKGRGVSKDDILRTTTENGTETERNELALHNWHEMNRYNHNLSARYIYNLSPTESLTLNMGYSNNQKTNDEENTETSAEHVEEFFSNQKGNSETFTATADYSTILWKKLMVQAGGKYSYITSDNNNIYENGLNENSMVEAQEQTAVGYLNVSQSLGKFYYSLGVRAEYQNRENEYHSLDRTDKDHSLQLVPKVGLNYRPSKALSMNLSYDYSRYNPSPVDLDPTSYFVNKYMYRMGNPDLKSTEKHNARLRLTHVPTSITLTTNYTYNRNGIRSVYLNDEEDPQIIKNLSENHNFSQLEVSLSYGHEWGIYSLNASGSYKQEFAKAKYMGREIDYSKPYFYVNLSNTFTLPKGFLITAGIMYFSKEISFPQETEHSVLGSLEIQYWNKDLSIRLGGYLSSRSGLSQKYAYLYRYNKIHNSIEQFSLSISYQINHLRSWFQKNIINMEAIMRSI